MDGWASCLSLLWSCGLVVRSFVGVCRYDHFLGELQANYPEGTYAYVWY